jgi:hypothetical protein
MTIRFDNTYYLTESRAHDQRDAFAPHDRWGYLGVQSRFMNRVAQWNLEEARRRMERVNRWADKLSRENPGNGSFTFRHTVLTTQVHPKAIEARVKTLTERCGVDPAQIEIL